MIRKILFFVVMGMLPALAVPGVKAVRPDTTLIHKHYLDGDFDQAIHHCEAALNESLRGMRLTHADSIFLFKHLGVMYTAKYETRELGKKYMYQLLHVEPTAKIMDMYASDMIYMIFKNIQDEYAMGRVQSTARQPSEDAPGNSKGPGPEPEAGQAETGTGFRWVPWALGGAIITGGAVAAYVLLSSGEPASNDNEVP
jgi:hypothetical protein